MNAIVVGASMDLFFEIFLYLKNDYYLSRITKISLDGGTEIKIYSGNDCIVRVHHEDIEPELAYLMAGKHLIEWAQRNENHASSSTKFSWLEKLKEKLGDEVDNAAEGWQVLSLHEAEDGLFNQE